MFLVNIAVSCLVVLARFSFWPGDPLFVSFKMNLYNRLLNVDLL